PYLTAHRVVPAVAGARCGASGRDPASECERCGDRRSRYRRYSGGAHAGPGLLSDRGTRREEGSVTDLAATGFVARRSGQRGARKGCFRISKRTYAKAL